ncbi:MAG: sensor histidine kinase [Bacteroidetes bacterium]|nr:MAG: sensor histidine kinase [Bacteroidota bacterium]
MKFDRKLVQITIKDYGIGIAENDLKNLFQSFYRGSNALTIPGTGLGLVIVKQFVEMHGGTIELESKLNRGTTIQITLPI